MAVAHSYCYELLPKLSPQLLFFYENTATKLALLNEIHSVKILPSQAFTKLYSHGGNLHKPRDFAGAGAMHAALGN